MISYVYLAIAIFVSVCASTLFKFASSQSSLKYYLLLMAGLFFGLINSLAYTKAMQKIDLSVGNTIFCGGIVLFMLIPSAIFFKESLTMTKILGAVVVCAGIYIISK